MTGSTGSDGKAGKTESEARKTLRRAWWLWRWGNRASNANDWGHWLWALFQSKAVATVAVGAVGGAAAIGTVAVVKPELLSFLNSERQTVEVKTERWADDTIVFPIEGVDKAGRRASFDFVVLSSKYTWARASADQLNRQGVALTPLQISEEVFLPEIRSGLARSSDLIAVGAASEEGDVAAETTRADRRARTAARWIAEASSPAAKVWLLNLGQFRTDCLAEAARADTSWQRPFIMVGVRKQEKDVVLGEALADAMAGKSNLPSTECYSSFALSRYP